MPVSKRLRYEIFRRDGHKCRYCGASAPDAPLRVDHVTPVALGGSDDPSNLVTACEPCNSGKTSSTPDAALVADVEQTQLRWANAMELAAHDRGGQQQEKEENWAAFMQAWNSWASVWRPGVKVAPLPDNWRQSVEAMRAAGLPEWMWPDIVEAAMTVTGVQDHFRYCCGIAWRRVRELQARAREILEQQDRDLMRTILDGWNELGTIADAWCEAWSRASPDGAEPDGTPQEFKDSLHAGMQAGLSIAELRRAAGRAGSLLDANLMAHLADAGEAQD